MNVQICPDGFHWERKLLFWVFKMERYSEKHDKIFEIRGNLTNFAG